MSATQNDNPPPGSGADPPMGPGEFPGFRMPSRREGFGASAASWGLRYLRFRGKRLPPRPPQQPRTRARLVTGWQKS